MKRFLLWLKWTLRIAPFFQRRRPIDPNILLAMDIIPPPDIQPLPASSKDLNRKQRRALNALERARRKHDILVQPKGTPPIPKLRAAPPAAPVVAIPADDSADMDDGETFIYGKHHRDLNGRDVLYRQSEFTGEYNFRDTILEQLDSYFIYLKRMKQRDPESYGLFKEIGASILPYEAIGVARDGEEKLPDKQPILPAHFNKYRPTFGCFAFGANPATEEFEKRKSDEEKVKKSGRWIMVPKFLYFFKYRDPPPELQPMAGGDIYKMTVWWDRPYDLPKNYKKGGSPQEYGVFISSDGSRIQILRSLQTRHIRVLVKNKKHDARGNIDFYHEIPQRFWRIPNDYDQWAKKHGSNAQHFLSTLFCQCAEALEQSNYSMVRVVAKKGDMAAVFGVNVRRMSYFFKDRDYVLNEKGARKPIFHMVRAHERHSRNGKLYYVPFHFRGERDFAWAGYNVSITVPGKDHFMLPELNIGTTDGYWMKPDEEYLSGSDLGKYLVGRMKQGIR